MDSRSGTTNSDVSPKTLITGINSPRKIQPPLRPRTASYTLPSSSAVLTDVCRKAKFVEAEFIDTTVGRGMVSMPSSSSMPPPSKRKLSLAARSPSRLAGVESLLRARDMEDGGDDVDSEKPQPGNGSSSTAPSSTRGSKLALEGEGSRLSFSSLFSMGSMYNAPEPPSESAASSIAGSLKSSHMTEQPSGGLLSAFPIAKGELPSTPTTATDNVSVTSTSHTSQSGIMNPPRAAVQSGTSAAARNPESWESSSLPRLQNAPPDRRSRSRTQRRPSGSTGASSASPSNNDRQKTVKSAPIGKIGVCALDGKARSKPSRNILTRLQNNGEFEVIVFGDKVILDEEVENWPLCDYLISFFSDGFPLDKAIAYAQLRKPLCVNDLPMQKVLWDRRLCLRILDNLGVPTPKRIEVNRDGGPFLESKALAEHVYRMSGVRMQVSDPASGSSASIDVKVELVDDGDTLVVDGKVLRKPFVEKPVCGEDHNVRIYFPKSQDGGGGRKLFRKIGNKSSEWDSNLIVPRAITEEGSSYVYEEFLDVEKAEDVKAYTVGTEFCHAETRKSPVVDGLVRRNTHGKEIRYITSLSKDESAMASKIVQGFGQRICGFDLLRAGNKSFVIDVNGWSFVKENNEYYDKCSSILRQLFTQQREQKERRETPQVTPPESGTESAAEPISKQVTGSHRAALKGLFRSPSLSKLHRSNNTPKPQSAASPEPSGSTTPITSPPTTERPSMGITLPSIHSVSEAVLPQPVMAGDKTDLIGASLSDEQLPTSKVPLPAAKHAWKLKGVVAVIRHADRTPKQKFKFTFHTQPFVDLLKGHQEEVLLKGEAALASVQEAVKQAMQEGIEDPAKLNLLRTSLARKGAWTGTKVQIKPMFRKRKPDEMATGPGGVPKKEPEVTEVTPQEGNRDGKVESPPLRTTRSDSLGGVTLSRFSAVENDLVLDKLQLIIKWGGEPTHSARYQAQDLGENMRNDLLLMNREILGDVRVFTSSEPRVSTSAQIWAASFLNQKDIPDSFISVRKDLLDDSNAAKDVMDKVKKKLKLLLREGHEAPPQFAWPPNTPEPFIVVRRVTELMRFHRKVMRHNFTKLSSSAAASLNAINGSQEGSTTSTPGPGNALTQAQTISNIQGRWCVGEDPELFKERWEKLFSEFSDTEKVDPSKISELYDSMKFDALHNRQFLEWVFTPSQSFLDELATEESAISDKPSMERSGSERPASEVISEEGKSANDKPDPKNGSISQPSATERTSTSTIAHRMGFRRKSVLNIPAVSPAAPTVEEESESYFKLFNGNGQTRAKQDGRLANLRDLYRYAKILFDFICPQEYGISDSEKLEIGLLTSLPLLKEIVSDLEEVQASEDAKCFIYFTKESHVYTLLNAVLEGGVKTKIARNAIPELDYLSQIVFELYESEDKESDSFTYSIKITLTPGCHTADPLDLQLDSKHSIGCAPRRSLTAHANWKEVIETLRAKFHTVKLPKSFLAVNLSERHARDKDKGEVKVSPSGLNLSAEITKENAPCAGVTDREDGPVANDDSMQAEPKGNRYDNGANIPAVDTEGKDSVPAL